MPLEMFVVGVLKAIDGVGAFTAVKPPLLTAVKPDERTGRDGSGVGVRFSCCSVAFNAAEARMAGESLPWSDGFTCFIGDGAGEGVNGPPFSYSSC